MANQNDIPDDNEHRSNEPIPDWVKWFREHSIPITGVAAVLLVICLLQSTSRIDWTKAKDFTDVFRNVTQTLAFIAGAIWAYFKFVKARTFQESLIPVISGRFATIEGRIYLVVTTQVKNVGLSKIEFSPKGSAMMVFEYIPTSLEEIQTVEGKQVTAFDLFERGRSIEPNEIFQEQTLIALPGSVEVAYRLELVIFSLSSGPWRATVIVDRSTLRDNAGLKHLLGLEGGIDNGN